MGSAAAFDNFILVGESAWQRGGRHRLPRTDTGVCSGASGTAQAAPALGEENDVLGEKKRQKLSERKKAWEIKWACIEGLKQRRAPSNGIPLAPRGSHNWWEIGCDLSFEGENQMDVFSRERRSLPSAPEEFDHRKDKRTLLFCNLIWGHVFSWKKEVDPAVKLHQMLSWSPVKAFCWHPSPEYGSFGMHHSPGELPCLGTGQTHLGASWDPCALYFESEKAQLVWLLCRRFFGQFFLFLWKWKLHVLLPESEQPSLFDTSLVALALFSELRPCVCYRFLFIFPQICVGQGEQHSDFTQVCNTLQLEQENSALDSSKKKISIIFSPASNSSFSNTRQTAKDF